MRVYENVKEVIIGVVALQVSLVSGERVFMKMKERHQMHE